MKIFAREPGPREPGLGLLALLLVAAMVAFIVIPMVRVVLGPGLSGYWLFFTERSNWPRATQNSIVMMLLSTSTAMILGFTYAYALVYSRMRWKPYFRLIAILPMLSPPFVVAASYMLLVGEHGFITASLLGISPTVSGRNSLWVVQTIAYFPYAFQLIADALSRADPRLEQAARELGAGPWRVFWTVTFPLARPGLIGATLLVAIYVLEDFGNPALIAGQFTVLPTLAYDQISSSGDFAGASFISTILLLLTLILYLGRLKLAGGRSPASVARRDSSILCPPIAPIVSRICFASCLIISVPILMVYGVLIVSALVEAYPFNMAPTLRHFDIVSAQMTSVKNSLISATIAGVCCSLMAVVLAYLTQRKSWPGHSIIDVLAIAPAAVPGIFFGIGYAATFNQHWFDRVARGAVITISMIFWTIPAGYQSAVAGLRQIDRSIDETATGLGAGSLRTLREILVPLLHAPLLTAFVTAFVRAITTLSVVLFLVTPSTPIATVTAFMLLDDSDLGGAAAMMVSVTALAVLVVAAVWTLAGRRLRLGEVANA